jgi:hypothetical protein
MGVALHHESGVAFVNGELAEFRATDRAPAQEPVEFFDRNLFFVEILKPHEPTSLHALGEEQNARAVVTDGLAFATVAPQEHVQVAVDQSRADAFAHDHRELVEAGAQVDVVGVDEDAMARFELETHASTLSSRYAAHAVRQAENSMRNPSGVTSTVGPSGASTGRFNSTVGLT